MDNEIKIPEDSRLGGARSVGIVTTQYATFAEPPDQLELDSGQRLGPITLAYETYGTLSAQHDNAVLVFHALSGDAHVAGYNSPDDRKPGWWDLLIGPNKPLDTNRYYIICANVIGGCKGSTGPSSINPQTGAPYGLRFPVITIGDMVKAQRYLVDYLGIEKLLAVVGGSMGGMQALEWAVRFPQRTAAVLAIATTARQSAQGIAFDEVGRQAIMSDANWCEGNYYGSATPSAGLAIARMIAHITYLSDEQMHIKFGRRLQTRDALGYDFSTDFQVESYLKYQGDSFVRRFDANSYLYITKAIDYYDLTAGRGSLLEAFSGVPAEFLVVSFTSDWLYPTYQSKELVRALQANGISTTFLEIPSNYGHDSFLLPNEQLSEAVSDFVDNIYQRVHSVTGKSR
ncbi:MAG: homoserine O-acetyltransferase [Chloroflexi bacterium]|nr:homoserine O-acetyltransferase [Chloroflexota bacterium]